MQVAALWARLPSAKRQHLIEFLEGWAAEEDEFPPLKHANGEEAS